MDSTHPQKTYISENRNIIHTRVSSVDGMQICGEKVGCKTDTFERAKRDIINLDASTSSKPVCGSGINKGKKKDGKNRKGGEGTACQVQRERYPAANLDPLGRQESEIRFRSLIHRLRGVEFSRRLTVKLLGGEKRMERLLDQGKIHVTKRDGASNTMWRFDASEVAMYVKPNRNYLY